MKAFLPLLEREQQKSCIYDRSSSSIRNETKEIEKVPSRQSECSLDQIEGFFRHLNLKF